MESEIVIIGGGLTGLTLHHLLNKIGISALIIEARDRVGGRINTVKTKSSPTIEMGATWLQEGQVSLNVLLKELGLDVFPQMMNEQVIYEANAQMPPQLVRIPPSQASYRIQGGTSQLIESLSTNLDPSQLFLGQEVKSIKQEADGLIIEGSLDTFKTKIAVSTLPPALLKKTIIIEPNLPSSVLETMEQTHTWMGESIKVGLSFKHPFWRANNSSGTIFCNIGPITEMYDHSNYEDNLYALKGFMNNAYYLNSKEERLNLVLAQLRKYYGKMVEDYIAYEEVVWRNEKYTYTDYEELVMPHQNNGHPLYQSAYLDGRLYIAGSETSTSYGGYMEGAVQSAQYVFEQIKKQQNSVV